MNRSGDDPFFLVTPVGLGQGRDQFYEEMQTEAPLRMRRIPAGMFLMGSPEGELGRTDAEGPQHEVAVSTFFMARYPITQDQWRVVAEMPQVRRSLKADPSYFKGDLRPVEQVSWYDAIEFCDRISNHTIDCQPKPNGNMPVVLEQGASLTTPNATLKQSQ